MKRMIKLVDETKKKQLIKLNEKVREATQENGNKKASPKQGKLTITAFDKTNAKTRCVNQVKNSFVLQLITSAKTCNAPRNYQRKDKEMETEIQSKASTKKD